MDQRFYKKWFLHKILFLSRMRAWRLSRPWSIILSVIAGVKPTIANPEDVYLVLHTAAPMAKVIF